MSNNTTANWCHAGAEDTVNFFKMVQLHERHVLATPPSGECGSIEQVWSSLLSFTGVSLPFSYIQAYLSREECPGGVRLVPQRAMESMHQNGRYFHGTCISMVNDALQSLYLLHCFIYSCHSHFFMSWSLLRSFFSATVHSYLSPSIFKSGMQEGHMGWGGTLCIELLHTSYTLSSTSQSC